jgi:hypothetical protein
MNTFFNKLYSYRERKHKNARENFLTEIFAFVLTKDKSFFNDFMKVINCQIETPYTIDTQKGYSWGRPDLTIQSSDTLILIEIKVEAKEGFNQLENYQTILDNAKQKNKVLVFLTKYPEKRPASNIIMVKWHQINAIANKSSNLFTREFQLYLNQRKMEKVEIFKGQEVNSLEFLSENIRKMEYVLNPIPNYIKLKTGFSPETKKKYKLNVIKDKRGFFDYEWRTDEVTGLRYSYNYGFTWIEKSQLNLYFLFLLPYGTDQKVAYEFLKYLDSENLENATKIEQSDHISYGWKKSVYDFGGDQDQLNKMIDQLKKWITILAQTVQSHPNRFVK